MVLFAILTNAASRHISAPSFVDETLVYVSVVDCVFVFDSVVHRVEDIFFTILHSE